MEQREICQSELTKKEVKDALNKMENNKTPSNDGLLEYCERNIVKIPLLLSFKKKKI